MRECVGVHGSDQSFAEVAEKEHRKDSEFSAERGTLSHGQWDL